MRFAKFTTGFLTTVERFLCNFLTTFRIKNRVMKFRENTVNLSRKLRSERNRRIDAESLMQEVHAILDENQARRAAISNAIFVEDEIASNQFVFDLLEADSIFHISHIRKICVDYRLRFLPTAYFKAGIPEEAITKIRILEQQHGLSIGGFSIVAPTKTFRLKKYDDPLLFAPIGNGYFYLIHQWGNDLKASRKWAVWPFRSLMTFTIFSIVISALITWITPETDLSRRIPLASVIVFLFAFKSVFAVFLYSFFILGKKFNSSIWDSHYINH